MINKNSRTYLTELMRSAKFLAKIKKLEKTFIIKRVPLRNIEETNNEGGSMFNDFACSNIQQNITINNKHNYPFPILKEFLAICIVEHIILENRNKNRETPDKLSRVLQKYESPIDSLINFSDSWIEICQKVFTEKPFVCLNCGLRSKSKPNLEHQCQRINLITHICPCGELFDNHHQYLLHVQPLKSNFFYPSKSLLPFPKCSLAGLNWLLTWLDLACNPNNREIVIYCHTCNKYYTNFITWIIDYSICIQKEMLMCQICSDAMGTSIDEEIPKLKAIFTPMIHLKMSEINLSSLTEFFINFKQNKNISQEEIMSLIGFENVFHFELNKCMKTTSNSNELRMKEMKFYGHRQNQLVQFLTEFPEICGKCYCRFGDWQIVGGKRKSTTSHICKELKREEHVCVCTARFRNHECYIFHRFYRCQFLFFIHIAILMVPHRNINVYSLCNQICLPLHDLGSLRNHLKTCKDCHKILIRGCRFCSDSFKAKMSENQYIQYFNNLSKAKELVIQTELDVEKSVQKKFKQCDPDKLKDILDINFYDTKIYCLKSGPPFSLVGLVNMVNTLGHSNVEKQKMPNFRGKSELRNK